MGTKNFTMREHNGTNFGDVLHPKTNIGQVEGLAPKISEVESIAKGAARAWVFDTIAALDAWLAIAGNKATLQVGDNFYIKAVDVPDYWWDGTQKQELETQKVALANATSAADGLMSKGDKSKIDSVAANATANTPSSNTPKANGTAAVGSEANYARGDHVHPSQTTITGNAGSATKLATSRTIELNGDVAGSVNFDGSDNVIITTKSNKPVVTVSATEPSGSKVGDIWYDTSGN